MVDLESPIVNSLDLGVNTYMREGKIYFDIFKINNLSRILIHKVQVINSDNKFGKNSLTLF